MSFYPDLTILKRLVYIGIGTCVGIGLITFSGLVYGLVLLCKMALAAI